VKGQELSVQVNGQGPTRLLWTSQAADARSPIDPRHHSDTSFVYDRDWWRRGETPLAIRAEWLRLGVNEIQLTYAAAAAEVSPPPLRYVDRLRQRRCVNSTM
jgi:hypothetical protein